MMPELSKPYPKIAGWSMHYAVGFAFTGMYDQIWQKTSIKPTLKSGAIWGAISGLAGIAIWKLTFDLHPNPPAKKLQPYFGHLLLAHIIFGIAAAKAYEWTNKTDIMDQKSNKL